MPKERIRTTSPIFCGYQRHSERQRASTPLSLVVFVPADAIVPVDLIPREFQVLPTGRRPRGDSPALMRGGEVKPVCLKTASKPAALTA